jgi:hypothetical protein
MNKRNTVVAIIILALLVMLLFTRSCVYRHTWFNRQMVEFREQAVCKKDFKPYVSIDSTEARNSDYPIVIHYKEPKQFGDVYTKNHIIGLTWNVLDSCPPMPDSTNAIHVYIRNHSRNSKNVYLGLYYKTSMNEDIEYKLTYPVTDKQGFHIATDSGTVSSVLHWKSYGMNSPIKFRNQADVKMTKMVEENLLKDVFKKMQRNEDSE